MSPFLKPEAEPVHVSQSKTTCSFSTRLWLQLAAAYFHLTFFADAPKPCQRFFVFGFPNGRAASARFLGCIRAIVGSQHCGSSYPFLLHRSLHHHSSTIRIPFPRTPRRPKNGDRKIYLRFATHSARAKGLCSLVVLPIRMPHSKR